MEKAFLYKRLEEINKSLISKNENIKDLNSKIQQAMADINLILGRKNECEFFLKLIDEENKKETLNINGQQCEVVNKEPYSLKELEGLISR